MLTRLPHWQSALSRYLMSCANTPFRYGVLDCGLFVAGAIEAMTGTDVAVDLRGRYKTRIEAFAHIKALCGHATMEAVAAYLAAQHDIPEVALPFAQRGDAVVLKHGRRSTLGLIAMHGTEVLTPYKDGLLRLPLHLVTHVYHI